MSRSLLMLVVVLVVTASASATVSPGVIAAFKGQIVITKDEVADGKNEKDTIAKLKQAQMIELAGQPAADVQQWHFHYAAFLTKTGASSLKMEFVSDDDNHRLAADKQLEGVDPKSGVLSGDITIDEDEGIAKGKRYVIELISGTNTTVSKAVLTFK